MGKLKFYLRARYYDPAIGRFINEDPIFDGYNWYAYCNGNPIMFHDPSGLIFRKLYNDWKSGFDMLVDDWWSGIGYMHSDGGAMSVVASYCEGTMNAVGNLGTAIIDPIGTVERAATSFAEDPWRNNILYQTADGFYNFGVSAYNRDWNSVAYSMGGATVTAGTIAAGGCIAGTVAPAGVSFTFGGGSQLAFAGGYTSSAAAVTVTVSGTQVAAAGAVASANVAFMAGGGGGGTPRNNQAQNRQVNSVSQEFNLSPEGRQQLHREISGRNCSFQELREIAGDIASQGGKYVK